jgi:hypothetical protein
VNGHGLSPSKEAEAAALMLATPEVLRKQLMAARERIEELQRENQDLKQALMKSLLGK